MMGALTGAVILFHFLWIALVLVGVMWTRGRPVWTAVHLACLVWGIVVEVGPWPCPVTLLENYLEARGGEQVVEGSFILHWTRAIIYPNAPYWLVTTAGVTTCAVSLAIYARRAWLWRSWSRTAA